MCRMSSAEKGGAEWEVGDIVAISDAQKIELEFLEPEFGMSAI